MIHEVFTNENRNCIGFFKYLDKAFDKVDEQISLDKNTILFYDIKIIDQTKTCKNE